MKNTFLPWKAMQEDLHQGALASTCREAQRNKVIRWKNLFHPYGASDITEGGGGADIGPLKEIGTGLAGFTPDSQRYFDIHHAATDVFENVSESELKLGAAVMAALCGW